MAIYDYATGLALPGWDQEDKQYELFLNQTLDSGTPYEMPALDYFNQFFSSPQPTSAYSSSDQYTLNLLSQPNSPHDVISAHPSQSRSAISTESMDKQPIHSISVTTDQVPSAGDHSNSSTDGDNDINNIKNEKSGRGFADFKLRSAPRKSKRPRKEQVHSLQARKCHNEVEKQYRTRLKLRFENLLAVLQASRTNDNDLRGVSATDVGYILSRGEVLDAAIHRILALKKENDKLSSKVI